MDAYDDDDEYTQIMAERREAGSERGMEVNFFSILQLVRAVQVMRASNEFPTNDDELIRKHTPTTASDAEIPMM